MQLITAEDIHKSDKAFADLVNKHKNQLESAERKWECVEIYSPRYGEFVEVPLPYCKLVFNTL